MEEFYAINRSDFFQNLECAHILHQFVLTKKYSESEDLSSRIRLPLTNLCCLFRQQVALSSVVSCSLRRWFKSTFQSLNMPFLCGQDRRDRPTQDPNEEKKSPPKPKPEPEPAIPEGRCNLHPTGRHKAKVPRIALAWQTQQDFQVTLALPHKEMPNPGLLH